MTSLYLTNHVVYEVRGEKAKSFLHGQLTNHILDLKNEAANYNLLLNLKGKVQADLYVYQSHNKVYIAFACDLKETLMDHLQKLALLSQVSFQRLENYKLFHILNKKDDLKKILSKALFCIRTDRLQQEGYDLLISSEEELSNFHLLSDDDWEKLRVRNGVPKMGVDFSSENLPQEARLDKALHFDKGCYLGQEIIARLHYRGHVNRILVAFAIDSVLSEDDRQIFNNNQEQVGMVTSYVFDEGKIFGLGYIPYKIFENRDAVFWRGQPLCLH